MLIDLEKAEASEAGYFDVCVIGAGAAGIALSAELVRQGKHVLLLEGGGLQYKTKTQSLYRGETSGLPFNGLYEGRVRALGGTTKEWGGQIVELDESDFIERSWVPGSGWPITKKDLERYYLRAKELEGISSCPSDPADIWTKLNLAPPDFGTDLFSAFSLWCPIRDFSKLYDEFLSKNKNVTVYLNANVCGLDFGDGTNVVQAAHCRTPSGKEISFRAGSYVLCMGGIEVCRLLLNQQITGAAVPWNASLVGRNYQDHISCFAADIYDLNLQPKKKYFDYVFTDGFKYHHKIKLASSAQRRLQCLNACGTVSFVQGGDDVIERAYKTFRLIRRRRINEIPPSDFVNLAINMPALMWHVIPYHVSPWSAARLESAASLKLCVHCEQLPLAESQITLSSEQDQIGMFRTRMHWNISELEIKTIRQFVELVRQAFEKRSLGLVVPDPDLLTDDGQFLKKCRESYHHMGGTRMGTSRENGVVDSNLCLFGTQNLYACSCSSFPSSGFANPTHTLLALAVRLADHLVSLDSAVLKPEIVR